MGYVPFGVLPGLWNIMVDQDHYDPSRNNFKICQRVPTRQFTEPRRYVENTIGSLIFQENNG